MREDFYVGRGGFDAPRKHFMVQNFINPGSHGADLGMRIVAPAKPIDFDICILQSMSGFRSLPL